MAWHWLLRTYWALAAGMVLAASSLAAMETNPTDSVAFSQADGKLRLVNGRVAVVLDEADGGWDATWPAGTAAERWSAAVRAPGSRRKPATKCLLPAIRS